MALCSRRWRDLISTDGLDWVIAGGPIGIGAEVGAGWCSSRRSRDRAISRPAVSSKHDVFATVGYAGMGSSEYSSQA